MKTPLRSQHLYRDRHDSSWSEAELLEMINRHETLAAAHRKQLAELRQSKQTNRIGKAAYD